MNKHNLEILGLSEGATPDDVKSAYETLRAKYLEERFMDGETGNNAAKMLTQIETAYSELLKEFNENTHDGGGESYTAVEQLIKDGNLADAQRMLDSFNERNGQWHYYQSVIFYRKNWMNESKKQLEIAIQLEPENEKYKETYRKLNDKISGANAQQTNRGVYEGQTMNSPSGDNQMGGNACANCLECCYTYLIIDCLCNACCR